MRNDAMEGLSTNPHFIRNGILQDHQNEKKLIDALRMFAVYNMGAFKLIRPEWFEIRGAEYLELKTMAGNGLNIFPETKNFIWKLNRLWVCRLCKKLGAIDMDWRVITVEYHKYLEGDIFNQIKEWEALFDSIKSPYTRDELCKIIGCKTRISLFDSLDCMVCHKMIKEEIEAIAGMKVFENDLDTHGIMK